MSRPEHEAPPEIFYDEVEAKKYTTNTRMVEIQSQMTQRALEMLMIPSAEEGGPKLLLDIGCGSGLSGEVIEENGHTWIGLDISKSMLDVALDREVEGDLCLADMGNGLFFRAGVFDGAISISALQWLCNADKKSHEPRRRLHKFFQSLYACLSRGARAIFQFYPENPDQMELITASAMKCGFTGGLVVDFPNSTKAKKYFLCLIAGNPPEGFQMPTPLVSEGEEVPNTVNYSNERNTKRRGKKREGVKHRDWLLKKKESQRRQGLQVRPDSKYTARKRSGPRGF